MYGDGFETVTGLGKLRVSYLSCCDLLPRAGLRKKMGMRLTVFPSWVFARRLLRTQHL